MSVNNIFSVVHVVTALSSQTGGLAAAVVQLVDCLATENIKITLISQALPNEQLIPSKNQCVNRRVAVTNSQLEILSGCAAVSEYKRVLHEQTVDLVHVHGLWTPAVSRISSMSLRRNIPIAISPHGMLEAWSMSQKKHKKRFAMQVYQRSIINRADVLLATSAQEAASIKQFGFSTPVAIIPNGVVLPSPGALNAINLQSREKKTRRILFLSRIHPKKGLLDLMEAWSRIEKHGWILSIAGPDEDKHLAEVKEAAAQADLNESVEFMGEVRGSAKSELFQGSDLFVLPTKSENFGMVVVEALSYGIPVITTKGAPWEELTSTGCGWWIDLGIHPLAKALQQAIELTDEQRFEMGAKGLILARQYSWDQAVANLSGLYSWLVYGGVRPGALME